MLERIRRDEGEEVIASSTLFNIRNHDEKRNGILNKRKITNGILILPDFGGTIDMFVCGCNWLWCPPKTRRNIK